MSTHEPHDARSPALSLLGGSSFMVDRFLQTRALFLGA
jgi:hypothetical protein